MLNKNLEEKISNNLDVSYYLNFMGEHALKAGIGYTYLHENYDQASIHPRVYLAYGPDLLGPGQPRRRRRRPEQPLLQQVRVLLHPGLVDPAHQRRQVEHPRQ